MYKIATFLQFGIIYTRIGTVIKKTEENYSKDKLIKYLYNTHKYSARR